MHEGSRPQVVAVVSVHRRHRYKCSAVVHDRIASRRLARRNSVCVGFVRRCFCSEATLAELPDERMQSVCIMQVWGTVLVVKENGRTVRIHWPKLCPFGKRATKSLFACCIPWLCLTTRHSCLPCCPTVRVELCVSYVWMNDCLTRGMIVFAGLIEIYSAPRSLQPFASSDSRL